MPFGQPIHKSVIINAGPSKVWNALTYPELMKQWMAETPIEIITDWKVGSPITIEGPWYKTGFKNLGTILQFEPERILAYSHLSSLSRLPDTIENYTILAFELIQEDNNTHVKLVLSNFPTESIYKHFDFYWNVALVQLKKFAER